MVRSGPELFAEHRLIQIGDHKIGEALTATDGEGGTIRRDLSFDEALGAA